MQTSSSVSSKPILHAVQTVGEVQAEHGDGHENETQPPWAFSMKPGWHPVQTVDDKQAVHVDGHVTALETQCDSTLSYPVLQAEQSVSEVQVAQPVEHVLHDPSAVRNWSDAHAVWQTPFSQGWHDLEALT